MFIFNMYSNSLSKITTLYEIVTFSYLTLRESTGSLTGNQQPHGFSIHGVVTTRVLDTGSPAYQILSFVDAPPPRGWRT